MVERRGAEPYDGPFRELDSAMPSLARFLMILLVAGALAYGAIYALATYVKPTTRPMETPVSLKGIGS